MTAFLFLFMSTALAATNPFKPVCISSPNTTKTLVYLHGWVIPNHGGYKHVEETNRKILVEIAKECNLNLIQPVSNYICRRNQTDLFCWNRKQEQQLSKVWDEMLSSLIECRDLDPRETIMLGFSDGGYFLNNIPSENLQNFRATFISGSTDKPSNLVVKSIPQSKDGHFLDKNLLKKNLTEMGYCSK
jgi:hypothetical protein